MSYETFGLALKSTIDYHAKRVADGKGLPFMDLAAAQIDSSVIESDKPAVCWELGEFEEFPMDPMWMLSFDIGAMTALDPSQYISLDITGAISQMFRVGTSFDILDYSGEVLEPEVLGRFTITQTGAAPPQQDRIVNVRFIHVSAKAIRYG